MGQDIQASRCQVFISHSLPPLVTPASSESSSCFGWHVAVYWSIISALPSCSPTAGMAGHWLSDGWDTNPVFAVAGSVRRLHHSLRQSSVQRSCFSRALYRLAISLQSSQPRAQLMDSHRLGKGYLNILLKWASENKWVGDSNTQLYCRQTNVCDCIDEAILRKTVLRAFS